MHEYRQGGSAAGHLLAASLLSAAISCPSNRSRLRMHSCTRRASTEQACRVASGAAAEMCSSVERYACEASASRRSSGGSGRQRSAGTCKGSRMRLTLDA
jgi:hypothetical protein